MALNRTSIETSTITLQPSIDDRGNITWYAGNSFELEIDLTLSRGSTSVTPTEADSVTVNFYDKRKKLVYSFKDTKINDNVATIKFTPLISNLFKPGNYTYCVTLRLNKEVYSLAENLKAEVKLCH